MITFLSNLWFDFPNIASMQKFLVIMLTTLTIIKTLLRLLDNIIINRNFRI